MGSSVWRVLWCLCSEMGHKRAQSGGGLCYARAAKAQQSTHSGQPALSVGRNKQAPSSSASFGRPSVPQRAPARARPPEAPPVT